MSREPTKRQRKIAIDAYAKKHGWICFYCGAPLVHAGNKNKVCEYIPRTENWDHCGCGKHDLSKEPCAHGGVYILPAGSPFRFYDVEHVVPKSRGGGNFANNLVLACKRCNNEKGAKTAQEYWEWKNEQP